MLAHDREREIRAGMMELHKCDERRRVLRVEEEEDGTFVAKLFIDFNHQFNPKVLHRKVITSIRQGQSMREHWGN